MRSTKMVTRWFEKRPAGTFVLLAAALVLFLYGRVLSAPFVYDDLDQIVNNPNLHPWSSFAHRFLASPVSLTTSFLGYVGSTYRPIFWLSIYFDHSLWGLNASAFHATNLLLHFLNGVLLFLLFRRLRMPVLMAAASGLIWLSLPVNSEVVAWISARSYELCTFFLLLSLISALRYLESHRLPWLVLSFLTVLAALLSHELGIVTLPLLLLILWVERPEKPSRHFVFPLAGMALAALLCEAVRLKVGVRSFSALASPKWAIAAFGEYLRLTIFPFHMSVERSTSIAAASAFWPYVWAGCAAIVLFYAVLRRDSNRSFLLGIGWYLVAIFPFFIVMTYQGVAERFAYIAGMGIALALVACLARVTHAGARRVGIICLAGWALWNAGRTYVRAGDWTDPVRLYSESLKATPNSAALYYNLGFSLREQGSLQDAFKAYRRALEIDPRYPNGYASLGDVYLRMKDYPNALQAYQTALTQKPDDTQVILNLGAVYQAMGENTEAENAWLKLLRLDANNAAAHTNLGVLYYGEQRTNDAMHQFAMAVDLKTRDIVPYYNLGAIFQQAGRGDLALVLYKKVLELKPDDADTLRNMRLIQHGR